MNLIATNSPLNQQQLTLIEAIQSGQDLARDLGNRPGNICFPEYLADQAFALAEEYPNLLKVTFSLIDPFDPPTTILLTVDSINP